MGNITEKNTVTHLKKKIIFLRFERNNKLPLILFAGQGLAGLAQTSGSAPSTPAPAAKSNSAIRYQKEYMFSLEDQV